MLLAQLKISESKIKQLKIDSNEINQALDETKLVISQLRDRESKLEKELANESNKTILAQTKLKKHRG